MDDAVISKIANNEKLAEEKISKSDKIWKALGKLNIYQFSIKCNVPYFLQNLNTVILHKNNWKVQNGMVFAEVSVLKYLGQTLFFITFAM